MNGKYEKVSANFLENIEILDNQTAEPAVETPKNNIDVTLSCR